MTSPDRPRRSGEHPLIWRKSSRIQASGQCVEIAQLRGGCAVRDSKNPTGAILTFTHREWTPFLHAVETGTYDQPLPRAG